MIFMYTNICMYKYVYNMYNIYVMIYVRECVSDNYTYV